MDRLVPQLPREARLCTTPIRLYHLLGLQGHPASEESLPALQLPVRPERHRASKGRQWKRLAIASRTAEVDHAAREPPGADVEAVPVLHHRVAQAT